MTHLIQTDPLLHPYEHDPYPLDQEARNYLTESHGIKGVRSPTDYEYAMATVRGLKGAVKAIEKWYKPIKDVFNARKKPVLAREDAQAEPYSAEILRVEALATKWYREEQVRDVQRKRDADEQARRVAEAQRVAEVQRLQDAARQQKDALVKEALVSEAKQLRNAPLVVPRVNVPSGIPKVEGISITKTYRAQVDDFGELVKAVAAGDVPLEALLPNQAFLNDMAEAMKQNLRYSGISVVEDDGTRARS